MPVYRSFDEWLIRGFMVIPGQRSRQNYCGVPLYTEDQIMAVTHIFLEDSAQESDIPGFEPGGSHEKKLAPLPGSHDSDSIQSITGRATPAFGDHWWADFPSELGTTTSTTDPDVPF